ncbi:MAG: carbon starvation protein A, partial [Deltaproteobacteria bacterium]|nr:carbon starvation protein A [Deltaproteobacteria bacterium]
MHSTLLTLGLLALYFLSYRLYHRWVAHKIFGASNQELTPAHTHRDNIDYVPTHKHVLWGHHFSSIAGAAPIVGPAIAVIWGWLPALAWVILGSILMGAVHDGGTLILSAKRKGKTIADITGGLINRRARNIFLVMISFLTWTVIAVFALVIAVLFDQYPQVVIPINAEIIVALAIGYWGYHRKKSLLIPSILALFILYALVPVGIAYPIKLEIWFGLSFLQDLALSLHLPSWLGSPIMLWMYFLLIYSWVASVLPVWTLLQPRDFINSHQLFVGLAAMYVGFFITAPEIVAPSFNWHPSGAPSPWPFLFITIACGAISGFHGLVSSGTTSKQLDKMEDACAIGCGSMLGEGLLAL